MSDRFRKAFRALLVCRDRSTRSEQQHLCMTGYATTNNVTRNTYETNLNTRVTRYQSIPNTVSPSINSRVGTKRNGPIGSGSNLQKAAAEAAAKNNLKTDSILASITHPTPTGKQAENHVLQNKENEKLKTCRFDNEINAEITKGAEIEENLELTPNESNTINGIDSRIANPEDHKKANRRHHHHHHHHHHSYQSNHEDQKNYLNKCKNHKHVRIKHSSCTDKSTSKSYRNDLMGSTSLPASCSLKMLTSQKGSFAKQDNDFCFVKTKKSTSTPCDLSMSVSSAHDVDCELSRGKAVDGIRLEKKLQSATKEVLDDDGEEHQIIVKLNGRCDRLITHTNDDTKRNHISNDVAITDTMLAPKLNSNKKGNPNKLVGERTKRNHHDEEYDRLKKDRESSGISSSASSQNLSSDTFSSSSKQTKQPLSIKSGPNKKQFNHYITEISLSTAL